MKPLAIFGINVLASFVSSIAAAALFAMPWLQAQNIHVALLWLVVPHMFLRFIGLSFLCPVSFPRRYRGAGLRRLLTATSSLGCSPYSGGRGSVEYILGN